MTGIEPIIYFISAVTAEAVKDVSKHIGKKAKEFYDNLNEDIIKLEIDKADNNEVIQQKLEAKPEIKANIEQKVLENQDIFAELLKVLKETSKQNVAKVENIGITGSVVTTTINQVSNHQPLLIIAGLIIFALSIVGIIALSKQRTEANITTSPVNSITNNNGIVNSQTNVMPAIANDKAKFTKQTAQSNLKSIIKDVKIPTQTESTVKSEAPKAKKLSNKAIEQTNKTNKNSHFNSCAETEDPSDGC
jgi:hypothetical protein